MSNLAVFISGSGSNAENIIKYFNTSKTDSVVLVISDKENAYGLVRARNLNVPAHFFTKKEFLDGVSVLQLLKDSNVDFIVLAGFLCYVPEAIITNFEGRMVNIHPSLLPKFGGKGMYGANVHKAVVANNEKESGITIHQVNEKFDDGEIVFQAKCEVFADDTPEDVERKVRALEIEHYPIVVERVLQTL